MSTYYLENGQEVYLKETVGNKYIVTKIYSYYDEYLQEEIEIEDKTSIVVEKIFNNPPIEKISSDLKNLEELKSNLTLEVSRLKTEKYHLENDIKNLTKTKISQDKLIINKSELINATSLALFPQDSIMPLVVDNKNNSFRALKLSMEVELRNNEERYWGYKLYDYDQRGYGRFLCPKYGILINPTQEQIDETIIKRLSEFDVNTPNVGFKLQDVPDKYLNKELLEKKQGYIKEQKDSRINTIKKELLRLNNELKSLE
jgi:predicted nuclease with TOPRIM domain